MQEPLYKCRKIRYNNRALPIGNAVKGYSSVGRAAVSKTACRGFKSFCPCQTEPHHRKVMRFLRPAYRGLETLGLTYAPQVRVSGPRSGLSPSAPAMPKSLESLVFSRFFAVFGGLANTAKYGIKVCQKCVRKKEGFPSFFTDFILCFCLFSPGLERAGLCACPCRDGKGPRRALSP